jgi:hypothetical protein
MFERVTVGRLKAAEMIGRGSSRERRMRRISLYSPLVAKMDVALQHGNYTSVDQLLQVVSRSVYNKIRKLVTV